MIWLLIILFSALSLLAYVFIAPIYVELDSTKHLYQIRFHRLISFSFSPTDKLLLEVKIMCWKKQIDLLDPVMYENKQPVNLHMPGDKMNGKNEWKFKKLIRVLQSFKVKACRISFDSYNMQLNGMLFPLFYFAGFYFKKKIQINFTGENYIILQMKNTMARMALAYIRS